MTSRRCSSCTRRIYYKVANPFFVATKARSQQETTEDLFTKCAATRGLCNLFIAVQGEM